MVSYSDILARNHANDFRRVVNDPLYRATFPTMRLERDTDREIAAILRSRQKLRSSRQASRPARGFEAEPERDRRCENFAIR